MKETSRCHKIGFLWTNIGVFVLVGSVSLSRFWKLPILDWKAPKIVHYAKLPWYTGQIRLIHCLGGCKPFLTILGLKKSTEVCNLMTYSPINTTLMFDWCIDWFKWKL